MLKHPNQVVFTNDFPIYSLTKSFTVVFLSGCKLKLYHILLVVMWCLASFVAVAQATAENRVLILGVRADAPPFSYYEKTISDYQGYSVSLCKLIAKQAIKDGIACDYELKKVSVSNRFSSLHDGKIDMLCGATTVTLERMRVADFSLLTFLSGISVMYDSSFIDREKNKTAPISLGMLQDTTSMDRVDQIWKEIRTELDGDDRDFVTVNMQDHYQGLDALLNNEIRAYIADREILLALQKRAKESPSLRVSQNYYSIEPYAIGLRLGDNDLRFVANKVLSELFDQNPKGRGEMEIINVLKEHFPESKFSKSLKEMFASQRLEVGTRITGPLRKVKCPVDASPSP